MTAREQRRDLHDQGMAAVPCELFEDKQLTDAEMRLALALAKSAWANGECSHTNEQLAESLGWSVRSVRRTLKGLADDGWIAIRYSTWGYRSIRIRWRRPTPGTLTPRLAAVHLRLTGEDKSGQAENGDLKETRLYPERSGPKLAT
jgi:hypothetical protein